MLTLREISTKLGVSYSTLRTLKMRNKLPPPDEQRVFGGLCVNLWKEDTIRAWVDSEDSWPRQRGFKWTS